VGKSSLFNAFWSRTGHRRQRAGTTRDVVSETASLRHPVKLYDTAASGGGELVESLGIERSFQAMADAI